MLLYLNGKIEDEAFMRFSVSCCRRVWPLIKDERSRAVVEATEAYLARKMTAEQAGRVCAEWVRAYKSDELDDRTGGNIHSAIEDVFGLGDGCACTVAIACFESAGFVASNQLRISGAPEAEVTAAWRKAEKAERNAQCQLIREMFEFRNNV